MACCVVFNFLIQQGDIAAFVPDYQELIGQDVDDEDNSGQGSGSYEQTFNPASSAIMSAKRDEITTAMWADNTR